MSEYIYGTDEHQGHWLTGEEIVRCEDCRHYYEVDNYHPSGNYVMRCCNYFDTYNDEVEPDGFCAWGERTRWRELENSDQYAAAAHAFDTTNHNVCSERGE